jgi:hypothetical protein
MIFTTSLENTNDTIHAFTKIQVSQKCYKNLFLIIKTVFNRLRDTKGERAKSGMDALLN